MVAAEWKNTTSIVRIHDEYCETPADCHLSQLSRIVSESYKRRQVSNENFSASVAATNSIANMAES